jgi:hypothetical protein
MAESLILAKRNQALHLPTEHLLRRPRIWLHHLAQGQLPSDPGLDDRQGMLPLGRVRFRGQPRNHRASTAQRALPHTGRS